MPLRMLLQTAYTRVIEALPHRPKCDDAVGQQYDIFVYGAVMSDTVLPAGETGAAGLVIPEEPFALFAQWMSDAEAGEINDPNAMTVATATADGKPSARTILLKGVDGANTPSRGFVFYTNLESRKGLELANNPHVALLFYWKSLRRQIRIEGPSTPVPDAEADAYFNSRPRGSRVGAWASDQSRPLTDRQALIERVEAAQQRFAEGEVPRPAHWSGYRVVPDRIEFWREGEFRLHDRLVFERSGARWQTHRLFP